MCEDSRAPAVGVITLRTARVLARELSGLSAFMRLVAAIADCDEAAFDSLVGRSFTDGVPSNKSA